MPNPFLLCGALLASVISVSAQEAIHPADTLELDAHLEWLDDGAVFLDGRRPKRALTEEEEAFDRGELLAQATARAAKEGTLVFWYIPRIIEDTKGGRQMYRAPVLDLYLRQVVFADPDVAGLLRHRFVPLRMTLDEPLAMRFDLRPLEFIEPAVVFLDGEGKVVHFVNRIRTFDALWFADLLRRVLDHAGLPAPEAASVEEEIAFGQWEEALAHLEAGGYANLDDLLLKVSLLRRLRLADQAFAALEEARARLAKEQENLEQAQEGRRSRRSNPEWAAWKGRQGRWQREQGLLLTLTGDRHAALAPLDEAFRGGCDESGYHLALNRLALGDEAGATRLFQLIAERHPDTLFGRRAQANVRLGPDERPLGAAFSGFEHYGYLDAAAYRGLPRDTSWNGDAMAVQEMAEGGVRFLLAQQRADGGFTDCRYAYWGSSEITPNTWVAITALACTALLEWRDVLTDPADLAAVDRALGRGEDYLFDPTHLNRGENEDVYADAYRLLYLTRRLTLLPEETEWATTKAKDLIADVVLRQREDGFFAHEYRNAFCTAVMLWSLLEARDLGIELPAEILPRGASALASARYESGAYSYGGSAGRGEGSLKDSSGRMTACESVLLRTGEGHEARLTFAFETFWEYFDRLEKVRLNDFHSDGELAGFFFFHDLFQTSEAVSLLPEELAAPTKARLLEILRDVPEIDGSFLDSHEFGRSYGTAMALLVLSNVKD